MNKKYLVLTELFLPTKGGTAVWFAEVYRRLGGKDIHIVTAAVPGSEAVDATHPNTIHRLKLERVPWLKPESLMMYLRLFLRAFRLATTRRFDAIHAGRALPEGLVAWLVARLTGHKVVVYAHGEELTSWGAGAKYRVMRFALRHADRLIANSAFTRDTLQEMGVEHARINLINPGVDLERFKPDLASDDLRRSLGIGATQSLVLSVGRLQKRKGFDAVIRAVSELLPSGNAPHYALIGIGEMEGELKTLAEKCGVAEFVHFLGHVVPDDLPRWYCACDLFAMPNRNVNGDSEGFGMVFIEAAACGKPSIAGIDGGTASAVEHGVTGLRVDGESVQAVRESIAKLILDPELRKQMGKAALARATQRHSWQTVADNTAAIAFQ